MSESNPIKVFVTHNFKDNVDYLRVFEFLESMERFFYINCSKPENVPKEGGIPGAPVAKIPPQTSAVAQTL